MPPIKKLVLSAGQAFGPLSGLGALDYGPLGAMRLVLGPLLHLPVAMPAPFLWELHLTVPEDLPPLQLTLLGDAAALTVPCRAGHRTEVLGAVHPQPGQETRRLSFTFGPDEVQGQIWFLGLSLLPLGTWAQP